MLDGTTLMNRGGIWQSSEQWNFQPKDGKIIVENTSKNKVLGIKDNDKVFMEDLDKTETKPETKQLWVKVESDIEGYFKLQSFGSEKEKFLRAKVKSKHKHIISEFTFSLQYQSINFYYLTINQASFWLILTF